MASELPLSAGEYVAADSGNGRLVQTHSFSDDFFFSFGRITAWLRPFRQGAGVTAGRGDGLSV